MRQRWIIIAAIAAAALSGGYAYALRELHDHTLHPFGQTPFSDPAYSAVPVEGRDGLTAYVRKSADPGAPVIVFFMGNVGTLEVHAQFMDPHEAADRTVIGMGFRGGGGLPGKPSEARLKADALALVDAVDALAGPDHGPVIVHGYSLGTGLAVHAAARRKVDGVILDAPFARICDLFFRSTGLSACWLPFFETWDSLADAGDVTAPVLIHHGELDQAIPIDEGRALAGALGAPVTFQAMPGVTHDKIGVDPSYAPGMTRFINALPAP